MITLRKKEKKKCIGRIGPRNTKLIENKQERGLSEGLDQPKSTREEYMR